LRPGLLSDWTNLVQPLRHYREAGAAPVLDWERGFKADVDKVVGLFADRDTPLTHWLPLVSTTAVEVLVGRLPISSRPSSITCPLPASRRWMNRCWRRSTS
jgi:hypothetical protein